MPADKVNKEVKPSSDSESVVVKTETQFDHVDIRDVGGEES